ncbi:hydrogenase maturation protease [Virgisporangium ochraceum]|uniref:Peptidase M52 n=1 Tax=Virgisporangium ochraceum TaxID=65505 RepID=A0A8J4EEH1_9ACTN|nr:hydrogenase maturation protease [Virgisporangium ochraceum]GIJ71623.1 peptidase M52 [Virgisporangium ochraceum]
MTGGRTNRRNRRPGGTTLRILIAGTGNLFLRDDAFGTEVVRRLAAGGLPPHVRAVDYGIRGTHLAFDLLDGWDALVLVDALPDTGEPGALRVLEVGTDDLGTDDLGPGGLPDAHGMDPGSVLAGLGALGGRLPRTVVVGCQVADVTEGIGLSAPVADAVDRAVTTVRALLRSMVVGTG